MDMKNSFGSMRNALDSLTLLGAEEYKEKEKVKASGVYSDEWKKRQMEYITEEYERKKEAEREAAVNYAKEFQNAANEYIAKQTISTREHADIVNIISALSPSSDKSDPAAASDSMYVMADLVLRYKDNEKALRVISSAARARSLPSDGGARDRLEEYAQAKQATSDLVENMYRRFNNGISGISPADAAGMFSKIEKVFPVGRAGNGSSENYKGRVLSNEEREELAMIRLREAAGVPPNAG